MAAITDLPVELVLQILDCWGDSVQELSSLSRCSRFFHWLAFDQLFKNAFKRRSQPKEPSQVFMKLVFHAIKTDSQRIAQWLCHHELSKELNGSIPLCQMESVTYLHLSIIADAPKVANHLVRYGTDVWEGGGDYPDITPLYLAIANPQGTRDLDAALRIACSYALPRTCHYLLSRGADPNSLSRFGLAAIHLALRKRLPWKRFALLPNYLGSVDVEEGGRWKSMVAQTVALLLDFGADPNMRSLTSRLHHCGPKCWCSPDCEHRGQTVLHFACGGGQQEVVNLLFEHGADPRVADEDGYLPLFSALCQDHSGLALQLLQKDVDPANPIIDQQHQSTALHIACRFASVEAVLCLLERGADANATDLFGRTPLHELLTQGYWELGDRILEVLPHLETYGAAADLRAQRGTTARQIAMTHPFPSVRQFFESVDRHHPASEPFQVQHCKWSESSTGSSGKVRRLVRQDGTRPEIHSRESFPCLGGLPPDQDGIKQAPTPDAVWLDKKKTDRLRIPPPPPTNNQKKRRGPGSQRRDEEAGSGVSGGDGGNPTPTVRGLEESRISDPAQFWSTLAPSRQKPSHQKVELTYEERKAGKQDVGSNRRKRGIKWAPLDLS